MERRAFFERAALGMLAVPAAAGTAAAGTAGGGPAAAVDVRDFGARGDGVADDTQALQAAIDHALALGMPCTLPAGVFRTTAPLLVGNSADVVQGFCLSGAGKTIGNERGGTRIRLDHRGHDAVLRLGKNVWRYCEIRDLGLTCAELGGARHGILFDSTEFSTHLIDNVGVSRAATAFGIAQGTGANGEFIQFNNCSGYEVGTFFHTNAGQAYVQYFHHCQCFLLAGGTYFHLDLASGGGGLDVIDFNASGQRINGAVTNTTLIKNVASNSCLNVIGGRIEHLTQLYECFGGTSNLHVTARFSGLQISVDFRRDDPGLTKPGFVAVTHAPDILAIDSCTFSAVVLRESMEIVATDSWTYILFDGCCFENFPQPPQVVSNAGDRFSQVSFRDCRVTAPLDNQPGNRPFPYDRHWEQRVATLGSRRVQSDSAAVQSGRPMNLLAMPHFTDNDGKGVTAGHPWVHFGTQRQVNAFGWRDQTGLARLSSPWSKLIEIPPHSGLYQDIAGVDLAAVPTQAAFNGIAFHVVGYQALINRLSSQGLRFSLCNSVDETIYDTVAFNGSTGADEVGRLITLIARVARKAAASAVRLRIENTTESWASVEFQWQFAADDDIAAFAPADATSHRFTADWALNAESGRFWHRLSLPYKDDAFGSASARPLPDLTADIYLSRTTEKVNFFANGRWWTAPRATSATDIPGDGHWAQGDLVYNSAPTAGSPLGWVQITPGSDTVACAMAWHPGDWPAGKQAFHEGVVYEATRGGTSSGPPTGNETGEATAWKRLGPLAVFKPFGEIGR